MTSGTQALAVADVTGATVHLVGVQFANGDALPAHAVGDPTTEGQYQAVNASGQAAVSTVGRKTSYSYAFSGAVAAATATDLLMLRGSGTKTVEIAEINLSGVAGVAGVIDVLLMRRSTADTGGTSSALSAAALDSANAAATMTGLLYSANPTLGTLSGVVGAAKMTVPSTGAGTAPGNVRFAFGDLDTQPIVLRGVNDCLVINLNAGSLTSSSFDGYIKFRES